MIAPFAFVPFYIENNYFARGGAVEMTRMSRRGQFDPRILPAGDKDISGGLCYHSEYGIPYPAILTGRAGPDNLNQSC